MAADEDVWEAIPYYNDDKYQTIDAYEEDLSKKKLPVLFREAKRLNAPNYKEATSIENVRLCLKIRKMMDLPEHKTERQEPKAAFEEIRQRHKDQCRTLTDIISMIEEVMQEFKDKNDPIYKDLSEAEPNFEERIEEHKKTLESKDCKIIVSGEICAGKTALINTLLGKTFLPSDFLSNTVALCEMRHGTTTKALCHFYDESKTPVEIINDEDFMDKINKAVEQREHDKPGARGLYRKVVIELENDFLENGLVIVDTPGIGDSQKLTDLVFSELGTAFAFIYVINTNNRLGVQEGRVKELMKKVMDQDVFKKEKDKATTFSKRSAIFVLNQWDKIALKDRKEHMDDSFNALKSCWIDLSKTQVVPYSAKEALVAQENGCTTKELFQLLDAVRRLIPIGLENKLNVSYCWTLSFLRRLTMQVSGYLINQSEDKEERDRKLKEGEERLKKLKKTSSNDFKNLRKEVEAAVPPLYNSLKAYLLSEKSSICKWTVEKIPSSYKSWNEVHKFFEEEFLKRLKDNLQKWDSNEKLVQTKCENLFKNIKETTEKISLDVENIRTLIVTRRQEAETVVRTKNFSALNRGFFSLDFDDWKMKLGPWLVPLAVVAFIPAAFYMLLSAFVKRADEKRFLEYLDPEKRASMMTKFSEETLQEYCKSQLEMFIRDLLEPAFTLIEELEKQVPEQIESDRTLVHNLRNKPREKNVETREYLYQMDVRVKKLSERLQHFQVCFLASSYTPNETIVAVRPEDLNVDYEARICQGLMASISPASEEDEKGEKRLFIWIPRRKTDVATMSLHMEADEAYSYCVHKNVLTSERYVTNRSKVCRIFEIDADDPIKSSLRNYVKMNSLSKEDKLNLLQQVADGLSYIHSVDMTHLDFCMDTIVITENKVVKLTNICSRQKLQFDAGANASEFIYIAPEVLEGCIYTEPADCYAFGQLMWELATDKEVYKGEIFGNINELLNFVKSNPPPKEKCFETEYREWWIIILDCLKIDSPKRLMSRDIKTQLMALKKFL